MFFLKYNLKENARVLKLDFKIVPKFHETFLYWS